MAVTPIIIQDGSGKLFALGLEWKRIVVSASGAAAEQAGYETAHKAGSNRLVFSKDSKGGVTGVGHAKFAKSDFEALSLAQAFALRHDAQDRAIIALTIEPGQIWVCATSEGMVANGYDFIAGEDEARERIQNFLRRWPDGSVTQWGDFIADAQVATLEEIQETAVQHASDCKFVPTQKNQAALRKLGVIVGVLIFVLAAKSGFDYYKRWRAAESARIAAEQAAPQIDPQEAWNQGLAAWVAKSSQASPFALQQLLTGLSAVPVKLAGWELKTIDCTRAGQRWGCVGGYERSAATRSTTEEFLRSLPVGWEADWGGMNKAAARFGFEAQANKVSIPSLRESKETLLPILNHLQRNSRAFERAEIGPAAAVPIELPKNPDGSAIVIDPSTVKPLVVYSEVHVTGPLRSFFKLTEQPVSWRVLRVSIATNTTADSPEKSVIQVNEAKGDIYAIK